MVRTLRLGSRHGSTLVLLPLLLLLFSPGFLQGPRLDAATLGPGLVERFQLLHLPGIPGGQVVHLRAVGVDVVKLPAAGEFRNQLPLALADSAVSFVLPIDGPRTEGPALERGERKDAAFFLWGKKTFGGYNNISFPGIPGL